MEDEELEEILGRIDKDIFDVEDKEMLKERLIELLNPTTEKQIAAFDHIVERIWEGLDRTVLMQERGIQRIYIEYEKGPRAGQTEIRYSIPTLGPGLWGWARVLEIRAAEGW